MVKNSLGRQGRVVLLLLILPGLFASSNCGGGNSADPSAQATAQTSIRPTGVGFVTDQAASNVLAFRSDVVAATLVASSGHTLSAAGLPRHIELRHLELAPAMLFEAAQYQDYTSLRLTLANLAVDVVSGGKVQTLTSVTFPALKATRLTVTVPINFKTDQGSIPGLMVDFNLAQSLSVDASGNYIFTPVVQAQSVVDTDPGWELGAVRGKIVAIFNLPPSIDLQLYEGGFIVNTAIANTTFFAADLGGFSKLRVGQAVEVSARFRSGTFTASFVDSAADPAIAKQGIAVAPPVDNGPIMMLVQN